MRTTSPPQGSPHIGAPWHKGWWGWKVRLKCEELGWQVLDKLGFTDDEFDLTLWGNTALQLGLYCGVLFLAFILLHRCLNP